MAQAPLPRRLKKIARACEDAGWTLDFTKRHHPRFSPPPGLRFKVDAQGNPVHGETTFEGNGPLVPPVTFGSTPSDHAADRPGTSALRRAGVRV